MSPQPTPLSIGKYRIDRILGEGSMGIVYKGYDESIDRDVAIKTIHYNLLAGNKKEEYLYRFRKEAQAAARCLHQSILTVFDYGEDVNTPYIVMEYYNGSDLKKYLQSNEISKTEALVITQQLLDGLQYAHMRGIVHRDLKPGNIFIQNGKNIKISDFGVARLDQSDITLSGQLVGTLRYMAPEMLQGHKVDHRADLYSTGIILYELLVLSGTLRLQDKNRPVDLKNKDISSIPGSCRKIISKALSIEPGNRFQTAASFALEIRKLLRLDEFRHDHITDNISITEEFTAVLDKAESQENSLSGISYTATQFATAAAPGGTINNQLDDEFLNNLKNSLAFYIGPLARLLVKKHLDSFNSKSALVEALAKQIPDQKDRDRFVSSVIGTIAPSIPAIPNQNQAYMAGTPHVPDDSYSISNEHLKMIEGRLAFYIGPLATTILKKVSTTVTCEEELFQRLAQFIPTEHERSEFLGSNSLRTRV